MRPILPAFSPNQRLPSGPAVIRTGWPLGVMPAENSVTTPAGVIRPIRLPLVSVNQRLPSGPAVISAGWLLGVMPAENWVTTPAGVIRPIRLPSASVNQRLPSGPRVIPSGRLLNVSIIGIGNSVTDISARPSSVSTVGRRSAAFRSVARRLQPPRIKFKTDLLLGKTLDNMDTPFFAGETSTRNVASP